MNMTMGTVLAALLLAAPAAAQRPGPGSQDGPGRFRGQDRGGALPIERSVGIALERRDSLGLSSEQIEQLEALEAEIREGIAGRRERMQELREGARGDRAAARERMADFREEEGELREVQRGRLDDVLSQEQSDRLGELMRRSRSRRPEGRGRGARDRGIRQGSGGTEMRAYLQGFRDGVRAGARFGGGRGRPSFSPGR